MTLLSRILGFVRKSVVARTFDAGMLTEGVIESGGRSCFPYFKDGRDRLLYSEFLSLMTQRYMF